MFFFFSAISNYIRLVLNYVQKYKDGYIILYLYSLVCKSCTSYKFQSNYQFLFQSLIYYINIILTLIIIFTKNYPTLKNRHFFLSMSVIIVLE